MTDGPTQKKTMYGCMHLTKTVKLLMCIHDVQHRCQKNLFRRGLLPVVAAVEKDVLDSFQVIRYGSGNALGGKLASSNLYIRNYSL